VQIPSLPTNKVTMQRGRKQKLKNGDEYDSIYKVPLCLFNNNTGLHKKVKKRLNKRVRIEGRMRLRKI